MTKFWITLFSGIIILFSFSIGIVFFKFFALALFCFYLYAIEDELNEDIQCKNKIETTHIYKG